MTHSKDTAARQPEHKSRSAANAASKGLVFLPAVPITAVTEDVNDERRYMQLKRLRGERAPKPFQFTLCDSAASLLAPNNDNCSKILQEPHPKQTQFKNFMSHRVIPGKLLIQQKEDTKDAIIQGKFEPVVQRFYLECSANDKKKYGSFTDKVSKKQVYYKWIAEERDTEKYVLSDKQPWIFRHLYKSAEVKKIKIPNTAKPKEGITKDLKITKDPEPVIYEKKVFNTGMTVSVEEFKEALKSIQKQNKVKILLYNNALHAVKMYNQLKENYEFDRNKNILPKDNKLLILINDGDRIQVYNNNNRIFPNSTTYKEIDLNSGFMTAGNLRRILPASAVGNFECWAGSNITHTGTKWIRVWDSAAGYWKVWTANGFPAWGGVATDIPGHVNDGPPQKPSALERNLAKGIKVMDIEQKNTFEFIIIEKTYK